MATNNNCPPAGQWPDPNSGPTYLNRFADGSCNYYIAPNTFTSETLSNDHQTYYMEDQIHVVTGGMMTVESGVTLEDQNAGNVFNKNGGDLLDDGTITFDGGSSMLFGCHCGIYVSTMTTTQGILNLNGSTLSPVTLSAGIISLPGSWAGILFQHGGVGNLTGAVISGAGSGLQCFCGLRNASIAIDNTSPTITGTTVDMTGGNGIEVSGGGAPTLTGNSVTNSTQYAVQYDFLTTNLPLITGLSVSGNKYNVVRIAAGAASSYTGQVKWPNLGVPLRIDNVVSVAQGATLTVDPGTTIQFGKTDTLFIKGTLLMQGTASSNITLTSEMSTPAVGDWSSVDFEGSGTGTLSYVHLSYAGALTQCGCGSRYTGINIDGGSPTISNTTVDTGAGNGIEVESGSPVLTSDTLNSNAAYPLQYDFLPTNLPQVTGLTATGNGANSVRLVNSTALTYAANVAWPNLGVPLQVDLQVTIAPGATLTVDSGTTVKFGKGVGITIQGNVSLLATLTSPITLTSEAATPAPGDWSGLDFEQGAKGTLTFVNISYGGALTQCGCGNRYTDITINGASPLISFSNIGNSAVNGVEVSGSASPIFTTDVFMDNKGFPLQYDFLPPTFAKIVGIVATGNGSDVIHMFYNGVQTYGTGSVTWPNLLIPLRFDGSVNVHAGATLNISSGAQIQFSKGAVLGVYGTLNMNGKSGTAKGVTVTSAASTKAPGDWGGIDFERGSSGKLVYAQVSYAGGLIQCGCGNRYTSINIDGSSPTISNTTIQNSAGNDVEISVGSLPVLHNDRFSGVPSGKYGVVVDGWSSGKALVDATNDWWNDKTGPYNAQTNPNGKGVPVSAGVSFTPWLTK